MEITRGQDFAFAATVALPLPAVAWLAGDPLFVGALLPRRFCRGDRPGGGYLINQGIVCNTVM
jgi:hypothetical protein